MSDALAAPPSEPTTSTPPQAAAPLSLTPQQVSNAITAAREVLGGCRVERVLELSDRITVAKVILDGLLRGELVIGRADNGLEAALNAAGAHIEPATPAPKNALPKPGQRPRLRRA